MFLFGHKIKHLTLAILAVGLLCSLSECLNVPVCNGEMNEATEVRILISDAKPATMCNTLSTDTPVCSQDSFTFFRVDTLQNPEQLGLFNDTIFWDISATTGERPAHGTDPPLRHYTCPNKHRGPPIQA